MAFTKSQSYYGKRDLVLSELGFNNYGQYLSSNIWDIVRRGVLHRDECTCRNYRCPNRRTNKDVIKQVHHLGYSLPVMLGINPSALITLCQDCHHWCEYDKGKKLKEHIARRRAIKAVSGIAIYDGISSPRIGRWFRNQHALSQWYAVKTFNLFVTQEPEWGIRIVNAIMDGKVSFENVEYLKIEDLFIGVMQRLTRPKPLAMTAEYKAMVKRHRLAKRGKMQ